MAAPANNILKAFFAGLSKNEKFVLYLAAGFVCLALFDRIVFGPVIGETENVREKIDVKMLAIKKDLTILQYKEKIMDEDSAYGAFFTKKGLTQEELIASFLSEVEGLARSSGVALTNINPVVAEDKKGYAQYSLTVECAGNMKNVLDFIYGIDNSKKPTRVVSFEIAPKTRDTYDVKCTLVVVKCILVPDEGAPAASSSRPSASSAPAQPKKETKPEPKELSLSKSLP